MGGASTEIDAGTADIVLEAAHWEPTSIARAVRRHKLPSEAAKRFERGVDPEIAGVALQRCVDLLVEHGGAMAAPGFTVVGAGPAPVEIQLRVESPGQVAGLPIDAPTVVRRLIQVGCAVRGADVLTVAPPSWRPDLTDPADLVEEVVRLVGYERVPSALPTPPPGRGLTAPQRLRRTVSRALAAAGYTEVLSYPFVSPSAHDAFGLAADDPRRRAIVVANPLSDAEPELRTSLLPGLLATLTRNVGRGQRDLCPVRDRPGLPPAPGRPARAAPGRRAPAVRCGARGARRGPAGSAPARCRRAVRTHAIAPAGGGADAWPTGPTRSRPPASWPRAARTELTIRRGDQPPWHPGRCAELVLDGGVIGHAGELHPRVVAALGLPERTCAMELDLDAFQPPPPARRAGNLAVPAGAARHRPGRAG